MKRILVVGSLNMDIVIETPCMPKAGETIAGKSIAQIPGGKGANQAFAAGKLGGNIAMMGAVGNDEKGEKLLESLKGVIIKAIPERSLVKYKYGEKFIKTKSN